MKRYLIRLISVSNYLIKIDFIFFINIEMNIINPIFKDILSNIFNYLDTITIISILSTCKYLNYMIKKYIENNKINMNHIYHKYDSYNIINCSNNNADILLKMYQIKRKYKFILYKFSNNSYIKICSSTKNATVKYIVDDKVICLNLRPCINTIQLKIYIKNSIIKYILFLDIYSTFCYAFTKNELELDINHQGYINMTYAIDAVVARCIDQIDKN